MLKNIQIICVLSLSLIVCSQDKQEVNNNPLNKTYSYVSSVGVDSFDELEDFLTDEYDAYIYIQEHHGFGFSNSYSESVDATFGGIANAHELDINNGHLSINKGASHFAWINEQASDAELFDRALSFKVFDVNDNTIVSEGIYAPKKIFASFVQDTGYPWRDTLHVGDTIYWNIDESNPNDVLISLEFVKGLQLNGVDYSSYDDLHNAIFTPDNGQLILSDNLFADIPDKSLVKLCVTRGNFYVGESVSQDESVGILVFSNSLITLGYSEN